MKVIIDPNVKQLFFDRIMERYGNYGAVEWIEKIAYGEDVIPVGEQMSGIMERIEELEELNAIYKKWIHDKDNRIRELSKLTTNLNRKVNQIDEEIEGYINEINDYKKVLAAAGMDSYAGFYDEDYDDGTDDENGEDF